VIAVAGRDGWRDAVVGDAVSVVSVVTTPAAHAEVALAALAAGNAVFCEKPLAASLADAEAMAAAGGRTGVNFSYRALAAFERFRELADGDLDVLWTVDSRLRPGPPSWKDDPEQGGGALAAYGVHALDYARWILGPAEVESASIEGPEDAVEVVLAHKSGRRSRIRVSLVERQRMHRLVAGEAVLENRDPHDPIRSFTLTVGGDSVEVPEPQLRVSRAADGRIEPLAAHARRFLAALEADEPFAPSFHDALEAQRLLQAARDAAR
jgi:predicted dehydrogenase